MTLETAWRSGDHVGERRPRQTVQVRRGVMDRHYAPFRHLDGSKPSGFGFIQDGKHNSEPWHSYWRWTEDEWRTLPNVENTDISQAFDNNGIATLTVGIENVVAKAYAGLTGTYHLIKRGYLSPLLGFAVAQRLALRRDWSSEANEWMGVLTGGYMVRVDQGYGDDIEGAFIGLIDDTDIDVSPDTITITCRDAGQFLTDQRIFGWNKAREILPPVIFADRLKADNTKPVGWNATASSHLRGHPARAVHQPGTERQWISQGHSEPGVTEYVEITLPAGRYTSFWQFIWGQGASMYVSVHVLQGKVDGVAVPDGWIDTGMGDVPGEHGGVPYVRYHPNTSHGGMIRELPFEVEALEIRLRISFRNLPYWPVTAKHQIGVARLAGYLRKRKPEAKQKHWILVDDASDVVKWCLMWAGFHEWEVEQTGVRLAKNIVFHQADYLVRPIQFMTEQGQFVFYMKPPTSHPDSIGVPVFRRSRVIDERRPIANVTDRDILTDVQPKWSKEALSYIVRVRGRVLKETQLGGSALGEDRTRRVQGVYLTPWSGAHHDVLTGIYDHGEGFTDRLAGLRKHRVVYDEHVRTPEEAMMMAVLTAIQEALSAYTMTIEVPGHPGLGLDEHVSVIDQASGVNSRMWNANRHTTFSDGTEVSFTTSIGGALVDTPDMDALLADYKALRGVIRTEP